MQRESSRRFQILFLLSLLVGCGVAQPVEAAKRRLASTPRQFGLGVVFGEPTGFSGKAWLNSNHAVDAGLAFSFGNYFLIYSDYLFHFPGVFGSSKRFVSELSPYVGIGGEILISTADPSPQRRFFGSGSSSFGLGIRIPLGIEWLPTDIPLGVFLEIAPGIGIIPSTFGFLQGGIGVRYYF